MALFNGTNDGEVIKGSSSADTINGNGGSDALYGLGGNDIINGGSGHDYLSGGDGNDVLAGGSGVNDLRGGSGLDTFVMSARTAGGGFSDDLVYDMTDGDKVDLSAWGVSDFSQVQAVMGLGYYGATMDAYYAGEHHLLRFAYVSPSQFEHDDFVYSSAAAGRQDGTAYGDMMFGSTGDDQIYGMGGWDTLLGGLGNDRLVGGGGSDDLFGGAGRDVMSGNAGADFFIYQSASDSLYGAGHDVITDFVSGTDCIDLCGVDANTGVSGNQAFAFVGTGSFTGAAQLRVEQVNGVTMVFGNTDADLTPEFQIRLSGTLALDASDFLL